jgi:hypothetical protein
VGGWISGPTKSATDSTFHFWQIAMVMLCFLWSVERSFDICVENEDMVFREVSLVDTRRRSGWKGVVVYALLSFYLSCSVLQKGGGKFKRRDITEMLGRKYTEEWDIWIHCSARIGGAHLSTPPLHLPPPNPCHMDVCTC